MRSARDVTVPDVTVEVARDRDFSVCADGREVAHALRGESINPRYNVCWLFWIGNRWWPIPSEETHLPGRPGG